MHQRSATCSRARGAHLTPMARHVSEIMSRELYHVGPDDSVSNALLGIVSLRITAAAVLDQGRRPIGVVSLRDLVGERDSHRVSERMSSPARCVPASATIEDAGRLLAKHQLHRLVVVDDDGHAVGMVSSLDVVRGLLGIPARHPLGLPHRDALGLTWTDPHVLDAQGIAAAPEGAGVLVLIRGGAAKREVTIHAEQCDAVRARLAELLAGDDPVLAGPLDGALRFRAAAVPDARMREVALRQARREIRADSTATE